MKLIIAFLLTTACAYSQDTTEWITVDSVAPRFKQHDVLVWVNTAVYQTPDSNYVQYRMGSNGIVQRREIWYNRRNKH